MSETHLKYWLGLLLQISIFISIILVLAGGSAFLWQHGNENLQNYLLMTSHLDLKSLSFFKIQSFFSPFGLIEMGFIVLVSAQVVRVALLTGYYVLIRDYWFMLFSFFILFVIVFSLICQ